MECCQNIIIIINLFVFNRFADDIEDMTGKRPWIGWMICWKYISPLALLIVLIAVIAQQSQSAPTYSAYVGCQQVCSRLTVSLETPSQEHHRRGTILGKPSLVHHSPKGHYSPRGTILQKPSQVHHSSRGTIPGKQSQGHHPP